MSNKALEKKETIRDLLKFKKDLDLKTSENTLKKISIHVIKK